MEILAQSSTAFVLTHNFQGTHILAHRAVVLAIAWHLVFFEGVSFRHHLDTKHYTKKLTGSKSRLQFETVNK